MESTALPKARTDTGVCRLVYNLPQNAAPPQIRQHEFFDRHRGIDKNIVDAAPSAEALDLGAPRLQIFIVLAQHVQVGGDLDRRAALGVEQPEVAVDVG